MSLPAEGEPVQPEDNNAWGDSYNFNQPNTINIISVNIQGLPHSEHSQKNHIIKTLLDVFAMQEMNTGWRLLPIKQRLYYRT